jgi:hypothetical protein
MGHEVAIIRISLHEIGGSAIGCSAGKIATSYIRDQLHPPKLGALRTNFKLNAAGFAAV